MFPSHPFHPSTHVQFPGSVHVPPFSQAGSHIAVCPQYCVMQPPLYSLTLIACAAIPSLRTDTCVWGYALSIGTGRTANSCVQNSIICRHDTSICMGTGSYVVYSCAPPTALYTCSFQAVHRSHHWHILESR